jgi:hypothetical protein
MGDVRKSIAFAPHILSTHTSSWSRTLTHRKIAMDSLQPALDAMQDAIVSLARSLAAHPLSTRACESIAAKSRCASLLAQVASPANAAQTAIVFTVLLAIPLALLLILAFGLCGARGTSSARASAEGEREPVRITAVAARDDDGLRCKLCNVVMTREQVDKHVGGKKHAKLAAKTGKGARDSAHFDFVPARLAEQMRADAERRAKEAIRRNNPAGGSDDDSDSDRDARAAGSGPAARKVRRNGGDSDDEDGPAAARGGLARRGADSVALHGKNVAVVYEQAVSHDDGRGGWTTAGGEGSGGGGKGSGGGGGGKGSVVSNLVLQEGGRNILEGFVSHEHFVSPTFESSILSWLEDTIRAGQGARLSAGSYVHASHGMPASLHFGCPFDWKTGNVNVGKRVDAVPNLLRDITKKIGQRASILAGSSGPLPPPDSVSIYDLGPGQFLPPHIAPTSSFARPVYMLALSSGSVADGASDGEDLFLGLKVSELAGAGPGEYESSFVHRLKRRSLVALGGASGTVAQHALGAVRGRMVVLVFRHMVGDLHSEMVARGSAV